MNVRAIPKRRRFRHRDVRLHATGADIDRVKQLIRTVGTLERQWIRVPLRDVDRARSPARVPDVLRQPIQDGRRGIEHLVGQTTMLVRQRVAEVWTGGGNIAQRRRRGCPCHCAHLGKRSITNGRRRDERGIATRLHDTVNGPVFDRTHVRVIGRVETRRRTVAGRRQDVSGIRR